MSGVKIIIGGDICPVNKYEDLFIRGGREAILGSFASLVDQADLFIANLECPLIERATPIVKTGPVLGAPVQCVKGLRTMGLQALGLANNHIMDHGISGLETTLSACSNAGIPTFGAGLCLKEASDILRLDIKGLRIGLLGMAEREWSIATSRAPGANPVNIIDYVRQVRDVRADLDYLVVLLHAGVEGYELPSPRLVDFCRFLVEEGANAVICQHSHCIGSYEIYQDQLIVYGQGNFIFDYPAHGKKGEEGILVSLDINESGKATFYPIPFFQCRDEIGLAPMPADQEEKLFQLLQERLLIMSDHECLEKHWSQFCSNRKNNYLSEVLGHGRLMRRLNRHGAVIDWHGPRYLRNLLSITQNESHLEVLMTCLSMLLGKHNQK